MNKKNITAGILYALAGVAALAFTLQWITPSGDSAGATANVIMLVPGIVGIIMAFFAFFSVLKPYLSKPFAATSLALLVLSAVGLVAAMAYGSGLAARGGTEGDLGISMEMVAIVAFLPGILVYAIGTVLAWLPDKKRIFEEPIRRIQPIVDEPLEEEAIEIVEEPVETAEEEASTSVEEVEDAEASEEPVEEEEPEEKSAEETPAEVVEEKTEEE